MNLKKWIQRQFRRKSRIYILPTKMGGYLAGLIFLMLLLSLGYGNNLLLIFTLFLFSFNVLWLLQTHFHLQRLKLSQVMVTSGHALDPMAVKVSWKRAPSGPWGWELWLESADEHFMLENPQHHSMFSSGELRLKKRGLYQWRYLRIKTTKPFGLYQVWTYIPINISSVVYPCLLSSVASGSERMDSEGEVSFNLKGAEDFLGLMPYEADESRRISWKHYARTGELLVREGEDRKALVLEIDLMPPAEQEAKELYLSRVATQLVNSYRRDIPFTLRDKYFHPEASTHLNHLNECLKVLALC
jgi:uncharacterized protein (DUF58 family)